jgi:hypothetical protein
MTSFFYINRIILSENCFIIMSRMLLINETFFSLPNPSCSMEYKQFWCIYNMKFWLIIHFIVTRLIDTALLVNIILLLYWIMVLFFYRYLKHVNNFMESNWLDMYEEDTYSLMIIVLKKELKLIFVYVYISFFCTWLQLVNSSYTVTYLNFLRWLIEASFLPQILILSFLDYFLGTMNFFELYHLLYAPTIIIKIPLFILMRYAEIQSNFFINRFQISFFDTLLWALEIKYLLEIH